MMTRIIGTFCILAWCCAGRLDAQIAVEAMKFGTGVESNEVTGEAASFPANVDKVYCWVKVTGAQGKTLKMKWYLGDKLLSDVPLEITYNSMRTYSYKSIFGNSGAWRVDVVDDAGTVVHSGQFTVEGTAGGGGETTKIEGGAEGDPKIVDLRFGTGVENMEIVGEGTSFPASTEKVYCWLKVTGGEGKSITVKWYLNGSPAGEVPLELKYNSMRTYSYKTIYGNKGEWKVEVVGPSGGILQSSSFTTE